MPLIPKRRELWKELDMAKNSICDNPWIQIGDFYVSLHLNEHTAGRSTIDGDMQEFIECVNSLEIEDMCSSGLHFTWIKSPSSPTTSVMKKLDRIMTNEKFIGTYSLAFAIFHPFLVSDHSLTVLVIPNAMSKKKISFKFTKFVAEKEDFLPMNGNIFYNVVILRKKLKDAQNAVTDQPYDNERKRIAVDVLNDYNEAMADEDKLLFQIAKVEWLNEGDRNTSYFHKVVKSKRNKNKIMSINNSQGVVVKGNDIVTEFVKHFEKFIGQSQHVEPIAELEGIFTNTLFDAFPNACEMWKAIERLKQGESINVQDLETNLYWEFGKFTSQDGESLESYYSRFYKMMNELIRNQCKSQELKTVSYHKLYDILKQHQHEVNEIRAEKIARVVNPLALVAQQQPVYHPQNHHTTLRIPQPDHNKLLHETEEKQLLTLHNPSMIKNLQWHVARECQKPKKAKDAAYHREKMLLCKQEEAGIQLNAEQADWRDDTDDDELEDQELEAHYMYMAQLQEVSPDAADSGPIFDDEPLQEVSNDDHYNVFAMENVHPEQSKSVHDTYPIEQDAQNVIIDSLDMSYDREEIDQHDDDNDLAK
nr:hypothetical protein [Tanacetum cinerariifolium]